VILGITATAADATTVKVVKTVEDGYGTGLELSLFGKTFHTLEIKGVNRPVALSVRRSGSSFVLTASRGTLTALAGCKARSARRVTCTTRDVQRLVADLGKGADRIDLSKLAIPLRFGVEVKGGPGNDTLIMGRSFHVVGRGLSLQTLDGGAGNDNLIGSQAEDVLFDGPGHDSVSGAGGDDTFHADSESDAQATRDTFKGGGGEDTVTYEQRKSALTIDLAHGHGGRGAELDNLVGIEDALAGAGADTLTGDAGPNVLAGGPGADRMNGGSGNDRLESVLENDFRTALRGDESQADAAVAGGAGDDLVSLAGNATASGTQISCGAGADTILRAAPKLVVPSDCETISLPGAFGGAYFEGDGDLDSGYDLVNNPLEPALEVNIAAVPISVSATGLVLRVSCPSGAAGHPFARAAGTPHCRGSLAAGAAASAFELARGAHSDVTVPLAPADAARLSQGVTVVVTATPNPSGSTPQDLQFLRDQRGGFPAWSLLLRR
jgi:Ca2+-binding RTX toxin-like protein